MKYITILYKIVNLSISSATIVTDVTQPDLAICAGSSCFSQIQNKLDQKKICVIKSLNGLVSKKVDRTFISSQLFSMLCVILVVDEIFKITQIH